jgi:hypothetical protein
MWDFLFENQIEELQRNIEAEVSRVVAQDPRITVSNVQVFPQQNGFLLQLEIATVAGSNADILSVFFDLQQRQASIV